MSLEVLIFDVDGTLADTEEAHRTAFNRAFDEHQLGWHWAPDLYRRLLSVTGGKERIRHFIETTPGTPALDDDAIRRLHAAKTRHYVTAVQSAPSLCGPACVRSHSSRQKPPCTTTTSGAGRPVAAGSRRSATCSGNGP